MSCPQGPFGSWKFDFFNFSSPLCRLSCPQGPFGSWKFDFFDFSSPLWRLSCPQGPFGSWKFDFCGSNPPSTRNRVPSPLWGPHERESIVNNSKFSVFGTHRRSHGSHRSHRRGGSGGKNCGSDPPSTRAGGQDDGSLHKLPQKIYPTFTKHLTKEY